MKTEEESGQLIMKRCMLRGTYVRYCKSVLGTGLPRVREKSGKLNFFQGQGIVREFCKLSGKLRNIVKCQGVVREF